MNTETRLLAVKPLRARRLAGVRAQATPAPPCAARRSAPAAAERRPRADRSGTGLVLWLMILLVFLPIVGAHAIAQHNAAGHAPSDAQTAALGK
ncbi:hypothetical protein QNA08_07760 [Chelatococcus sp. SYSU_G07232]|uniref:Uncharacterized protein n=1 Tax=Chelatococcus albus TaxID=3047466 RepID=A0ABT7AG84_9HYPH|nr:hypothetical protein [Chelatococcus sp. SYSU_G07232]MDJ1158125.1 hypothetical protein [Chelatococcus sp. SYSU_G07232]